MPGTPAQTSRRLIGPRSLSVLGAALVIPIPVFAANPAWIPDGFLGRIGGAPLLTWLLVAVMAALVGVAVLCALAITPED